MNSNSLYYGKYLRTSALASILTENSTNAEDELHSTMDCQIQHDYTGKDKNQKSKRIKDFLSSENGDFYTLLYTSKYFQKGRKQMFTFY
jgi:hypothetical protein